jgi:hypothetical protein
MGRRGERMEWRISQKQTPGMISALVSLGLLLFIGAMGGEPAWAQGPVKERTNDRGNPFAQKTFAGAPERNPFLLPPGVSLLSKGGPHEKAAKAEMKPPMIPPPAPLRVKAILISDTIRLAAIDQYIVGVGDAIQDEKVLEIKTDRVILGKGNDKKTLLLSQSHIPLTVEREPSHPLSQQEGDGKK